MDTIIANALFTGHKRILCFKFQSLYTPDALIFHLYGPEDGRRDDTTLYAKFEIGKKLQTGLLVNGV